MPSSSIQPFIRNASCPSADTFGLSRSSTKYSSSATNLAAYSPRSTREKKRNLLQRIKSHVWNFFRSPRHRPSPEPVRVEPSIFSYDPEIDLREDHLSLLCKHLSATLGQHKIARGQLTNIARQCLIMSAEEPFGILAAQILVQVHHASNQRRALPIIRLNPKQKTIFEIEINLCEETKVFTFRRLLPDLSIFDELKEKSPLYISARCSLVKHVFYKTAEPKRAFLTS